MFVKTIDGTPDAVKVACPVLAGGKAGDYIKGLPIRTSCIKCQRPVYLLTFENDFTIILELGISYIKIINILLLRFIVPYGRHEPMILVVIF